MRSYDSLSGIGRRCILLAVVMVANTLLGNIVPPLPLDLTTMSVILPLVVVYYYFVLFSPVGGVLKANSPGPYYTLHLFCEVITSLAVFQLGTTLSQLPILAETFFRQPPGSWVLLGVLGVLSLYTCQLVDSLENAPGRVLSASFASKLLKRLSPLLAILLGLLPFVALGYLFLILNPDPVKAFIDPTHTLPLPVPVGTGTPTEPVSTPASTDLRTVAPSPAPTATPDVRRVQVNGLANKELVLRTGPNAATVRKGVLREGTRVQVSGPLRQAQDQGCWAFVKTLPIGPGSREGWVNAGYLDPPTHAGHCPAESPAPR